MNSWTHELINWSTYRLINSSTHQVINSSNQVILMWLLLEINLFRVVSDRHSGVNASRNKKKTIFVSRCQFKRLQTFQKSHSQSTTASTSGVLATSWWGIIDAQCTFSRDLKPSWHFSKTNSVTHGDIPIEYEWTEFPH